MAKSFYTLEETAAKLKKSAAEVNAIADTGRLQRVTHEGQPKFRVEQVDLLANVMGDGGSPRLDDSHAPIGLADSSGGTAIGAAPPSGRRPANEDSVLGLADTTLGKAPSLADSSERTGVSAIGNRGGDAVEIGLETWVLARASSTSPARAKKPRSARSSSTRSTRTRAANPPPARAASSKP